MSWFSNFFNRAPKTPEVLAAEDKVKSAQSELEAVKKAASESAAAPAPPAVGTAPLTGARRRKTRRSKKSKSKRSRTGRKSSRL